MSANSSVFWSSSELNSIFYNKANDVWRWSVFRWRSDWYFRWIIDCNRACRYALQMPVSVNSLILMNLWTNTIDIWVMSKEFEISWQLCVKRLLYSKSSCTVSIVLKIVYYQRLEWAGWHSCDIGCNCCSSKHIWTSANSAWTNPQSAECSPS